MSAADPTPAWPRLDSEPPLFHAGDLGPADRDLLTARGWLREAAPGGFAACPGCGRGWVGRVEWFPQPGGVPPRGFVPCPGCGAAEIDPGSLRRWLVDVPALLKGVAAAAGVRGTQADLGAGRVWHLGHARWSGTVRDVLFARNVVRDARPVAVAVVGKRPRAVLLVPTEESAAGWIGTVPNPVVALESVAAFTADGLAFDLSAVEGRLADAVPSNPAQPRKSAHKRGERAAKIEKLTAELNEHLRAARDHAYATRERMGIPVLLPRPTQKHLAARTGLTESDVSRCLSDPQGRLLKLLWDTAGNLHGVLSHKS